jgi:Short C-terminal domain
MRTIDWLSGLRKQPLKTGEPCQMSIRFLAFTLAVVTAGCATPPSSDPSTVEPECAQQCSANLATCSSGFKLFPIVQQKQCNDTYDVCIKGCPARAAATAAAKPVLRFTSERLKRLEELFKSGAITKQEYDAKRKEILGSL